MCCFLGSLKVPFAPGSLASFLGTPCRQAGWGGWGGGGVGQGPGALWDPTLSPLLNASRGEGDLPSLGWGRALGLQWPWGEGSAAAAQVQGGV